MRILALERDLTTTPRPDAQESLRAEAAQLWAWQKQGIIREIWFTAAQRRAVLLLECANAAEARKLLGTLPLVLQGLSEFEVLELSAYDGWERLFAAASGSSAVPAEPPEY